MRKVLCQMRRGWCVLFVPNNNATWACTVANKIAERISSGPWKCELGTAHNSDMPLTKTTTTMTECDLCLFSELRATSVPCSDSSHLVELITIEEDGVSSAFVEPKPFTLAPKVTLEQRKISRKLRFCLEPLGCRESPKLPNCGHAFHCQCLVEWMRTKTTCPVCREEAREERRQG
jgi:hypothetical protein